MLDKVAKPFNVELPEADGLDDTLNKILPAIRKHSEDLREEDFFLKKNWIEIRDDEDFHETILHIFDEGGEYVCSTDGNIECGEWRHMNGKFVYGPSSCDAEVFDLAFLDDEFFILAKHGNPRNFERRYRVFLIEKLSKKMEWNEAMEYFFDKYRNSNGFLMVAAILLLAIIAAALLLS
ncbi:MAG: hypothetical protein DA408_20970 [Bacteroidetes bacterium]|nr:MAG: hypothetical protein DA408_20970 [Bacteroidota bacterium]